MTNAWIVTTCYGRLLVVGLLALTVVAETWTVS